MSLLLIRHGETDLNAARVVQFPDTPLGARGLEQAERLGASLRMRPLRLVLTSDYVRARMTAERIAAHTGAPLVELTDLRERNFGDLRGRAYESFVDLDPFAPDYEPPNGESWPAFHARVDRAWNEIVRRRRGLDGDLAVVTHGLVLRSLLERVLDSGGHSIEPGFTAPNTSLTLVEPEPPWRVLALASTAHLGEASADGAPV